MFDSFSNVDRSRFTEGGYNMGSYWQCLDHGRFVLLGIDMPLLDASKNITSKLDWRLSRYLNIMPARHINPIPFGICIPHECKQNDLDLVISSEQVQAVIKPLSLWVMSTVSNLDQSSASTTQTLAFRILLAIFALGVISMLANILKPASTMSRALKPFDVLVNCKHLFSPTKNPSSLYMNANIHRLSYFFMSVASHILLHVSYSANVSRLEASAATIFDHFHRFSPFGILITALPPGMVTNFIVAAAFASIKWLPVMRKRKVSFAEFAYARMIRTMPVVFTMLLILHALPLLVIGPGPMMAYTASSISDTCYRNGWKELLFISNFGDLQEICLPVAWFISAEMQLYLMSFCTLTLIAKFPNHVAKISAAHLMIALIASGIFAYITKIPAVMSLGSGEVAKNMTLFPLKIYHTTNYPAVYLIGILLGIKLLNQCGKKSGDHPLLLCLLNAIVSSGCIFHAMMYGDGGGKYDSFAYGPLVQLVYETLVRPLFAVVIAMSIYFLINCKSEILQSIASSRIVVVFSRVSFCWFMAHAVCIIVMIGSYETTAITRIQLIMEYVFIVIISFPLACLLYVLVEIPFGKILSSGSQSSGSREVSE